MMTKNELLLTILAEECVETAQRATKSIRFGIDEIQKNQELNNSERLIYEFNDIYAVMEMLLEEGVISTIIDRDAIEKKKQKILKYMEYSRSLGIVQ
jgi:hypothetical protein